MFPWLQLLSPAPPSATGRQYPAMVRGPALELELGRFLIAYGVNRRVLPGAFAMT